jgi:uncharacterized protein
MAEAPTGSTVVQVIEAYGAGGFRVSGRAFRGSILVLPDGIQPWPVSEMSQLNPDSLALVLGAHGVEILLIGCGARTAMIAPALRQALRERGVVIDAMDTGAACRTFNVLRAEGRQVAAALIAVG